MEQLDHIARGPYAQCILLRLLLYDIDDLYF